MIDEGLAFSPPLFSSRCTSLSFSLPAFVSCVVALLCVSKRVDGPPALSGDEQA